MGDVHVVGKVHQSVGWRLLMVIDPFLGDPWKKSTLHGSHLERSPLVDGVKLTAIHICIYKLLMSV